MYIFLLYIFDINILIESYRERERDYDDYDCCNCNCLDETPLFHINLQSVNVASTYLNEFSKLSPLKSFPNK